MVYLVDTFGRLGFGQSPQFTVSEKLRREKGNTTPSQKENQINKHQRDTNQSHMDRPTIKKPR